MLEKKPSEKFESYFYELVPSHNESSNDTSGEENNTEDYSDNQTCTKK